MDNALVEQIYERSKGYCEICGSTHMLEIHHIIFGKGKRKQHERIESIILLCYSCHRGTNGVHGKNGRKLDIRLKQRLQKTYQDKGYTEEEIRELMGGRLY